MGNNGAKEIVRLRLVLQFSFRRTLWEVVLKRSAPADVEEKVVLPAMSWGGFERFTFSIGESEKGNISIVYGFLLEPFRAVELPYKFRFVRKIEWYFERTEKTM